MTFTTYKLVNSIGLFLDIIGVLIIFKFSPIMQSVTFFYSDEQHGKMMEKDKKKNKLAKIGLTLILIGFLTQISSNFL